MPTFGSPPVRRRRLAAELRRLRTSAGKTAEDVGKVLGWSKAKISRYELAQGGLKPADVDRLLQFHGVQESQREQLLALAEEATHKGWWEAYDDVLTEGHLEYIWNGRSMWCRGCCRPSSTHGRSYRVTKRRQPSLPGQSSDA